MLRVLIPAAACSMVVAVAAAVNAGGKTQRTTTLRFDETNPRISVVDIPPANAGAAPEAGDTVLFVSDLVSGGRKVGTKRGSCTVVDAPLAECMATLTFSGGHVTVVDTFNLAPEFGPRGVQRIAFSGGTGAYRGAYGDGRVTQINDARSRWVVALTRPDRP